MKFVLLPVLAACAIAACQAAPASDRLATVTQGSPIIPSIVDIQGRVVTQPLISNNGGGLISHNGGSLISHNGGSYRLLDGINWLPLANASISLVDPFGQTAAGVPGAVTDGLGHFTLHGAPAGVNWLIQARSPQALLETLVRPSSSGVTSDVTPATALLSAHLENAFQGQAALFFKVSPTQFDALVKEITQSLQAAPQALDLSSIQSEDEAFNQLAQSDPAIAAAFDALASNARANQTPSDTQAPSPTASNVAEQLGTYRVGNAPLSIALDSKGHLWAANSASNDVSELTNDGASLGTYPVGVHPAKILISSSDTVYVANAGESSITQLGFDGHLLSTFSVGRGPSALAFDSSGNIWVAGAVANDIEEWSAGGQNLAIFPSGAKPLAIAIAPNDHVWSANYGDNSVSLIIQGTITHIPVGLQPVALALDSAGNAWVVESGAGGVSEISPQGQVLGHFPTGISPHSIAIDPTGRIWVSNQGDGTVTSLSPTGQTLASIHVGSAPTALLIDPTGTLWVTSNGTNTLTAISPTARLLGTIPVGSSPDGLALDSQGALWVNNLGSNDVTKLARR